LFYCSEITTDRALLFSLLQENSPLQCGYMFNGIFNVLRKFKTCFPWWRPRNCFYSWLPKGWCNTYLL